MELSFDCENSADASYLAQQLEIALRSDGVPADALSLRQSSDDNMDIGSILHLSLETASYVLGPAASLATFAKCIYEVVTKHNSTILIVSKDGRVRIPASKISLKRIENALGKSSSSKSKSGTKRISRA
jgi:hypothetical protein